MDNKEAIKYLIPPVATSTQPSAEYLKQKEAYDLAIKVLKDVPKGEWKGGFTDALDKAFSEFDANCTYSGDSVLQKIGKLKECGKLCDENGQT